MKNIMMIDGAVNCVYDIFAATDEEFSLIFLNGQDIAFEDELSQKGDLQPLRDAFANIYDRPVAKRDAQGIHGILFFELECKKRFYPTRRDDEAMNPNGTALRHNGRSQHPYTSTSKLFEDDPQLQVEP